MTNMRPMTQAEHIDAARKLLKPNPVAKGETPEWLQKILDDVYGGLPFSSVMKSCGSHYRVDHWGTSKGDYRDCPDDCFVMELYGVCTEELVATEKFCDRHNLSFYTHANSWHYPGKTIRIAIYQDHEKE